MNSELMALADRCEAATCADYAIDLEIADYGYRNGALFGVNYDPRLWMERNCWEPTASLDAAMALVPDGYKPMLCQQIDDDRWRANLWFGKAQGVGFCYAATPALALTAACLRAIVSQEKPA